MTITDSWQEKSDRELAVAAERIDELTEEEERSMREELRRRGIPEPLIFAQVLGIFVAIALINSMGLSQIMASILVGSIGSAIFLAAMYQKWDFLE
jgi:hypothetical protein